MGITVVLPNGEEVDVETDDPKKAAVAARRYMARQEPGYQAARRDADAFNRARRTYNPLDGTPLKFVGDAVNAIGGFNDQMSRNIGVGDDIHGWTAKLGAMIRGEDRYTPEQAYMAASDAQRSAQAVYARQHPVANAAATVAGLAVAGRPALGAPSIAAPVVAASRTAPAAAAANAGVRAARMAPMTNRIAEAAITRQPALVTGAQMAAANAPFALARQEGTFAERLPGAAVETAIAGGLGAGAQGLSNALVANATKQAERLAAFQAAGVRPTAAAVNGGGSAPLTKAVAENPIAGIPARARLRASLNDTRDAAQRISQQMGRAGPTDLVGQRIQEGVERFANGPARRTFRGGPKQRFKDALHTGTREVGSFSAKAEAIYTPLWQRLEQIVARRAKAGQTTPTTLSSTKATLSAIGSRVQNPALGELTQSPMIGRIAQKIDEAGENVSLSDLRHLRTWVRRAQRDPLLRQDADAAALQSIERALTEDIYASVKAIAGPSGVRQLQVADAFYRKGSQRIQDALQTFASSRSGEDAYRRVIAAASQGSGGDLKRLVSLKLALAEDEWGDIAATVVSNLGRPTKGAANAAEEGAFSIETFLTNYMTLSERGRRVLFGDVGGGGAKAKELHAALENLAKVAGMQKAVEGAANTSNSAVAGQSVAMLGAIGAAVVNPSLAPPLLAGMAAGVLTGEVMTNPAFVRWLASAPAAGQTVGGMRRHLAILARMSAANPTLKPAYEDVQRLWAPMLEANQPRPEPAVTPQ